MRGGPCPRPSSPAPRSHPGRRFRRRAARRCAGSCCGRAHRGSRARGERIGDPTGPAGRTRRRRASARRTRSDAPAMLTSPARSSSASASPDGRACAARRGRRATSSEVSAAITAIAVRVVGAQRLEQRCSGERHVGGGCRHVGTGGTSGALVGRQRADELDRDSRVATGERGHAADHPIGRRHGGLHRRSQRLDVQSVEHHELVADRPQRVGGPGRLAAATRDRLADPFARGRRRGRSGWQDPSRRCRRP